MFNWTFASLYSLSCALLPCVLLLIVRRQAAPWTHHLWALLFCCYLWAVYEVTGAGGLSDVFLQLNIFRDLGIHSFSDLFRALHDPQGATVFRSRINLIPLQDLSNGFRLNILMTMPLGFFLPFLYRSWRRFG